MARLLNYRNCIIILSVFFIVITVLPKLSFPDLNHGDEYSDASTLVSGKNFIKFGFMRCRFLPIFEPHLEKPSDAYTHAPPLSDIMNGLLRLIFRTDSLRFFRGVSLLFSLFNLLVWYTFMKKFTNSYIFSFLASIFYFANPFFNYGADSLYQNAYVDFLRVLIFIIFFIMVRSSERKRISLLFFLWMLVFISSLFTYEYIVYYSLFFILYGYFFKTPVSRKTIFVLLSAPICGFLLHFLQNSWHFGSFSLALYDLKDSFFKRTTGGYELPQGLQFSSWFKYVILRNFSLAFYFDTFVALLSIFFAFLLYSKLSDKSREEIKKLFYLFIIFIICGISWYVFFPSHSLAHAFVNFLPRHLVPAAAIGFTIFTYIIYSFLKENNLWKNAYLRTSWILIVGVIIFTGIFKSELPITLDKIRRAQDFKVFTHCLLKLREISSEKDDIGVNYYRFPFIRYYTNRHCNAIFDKDSMEKLPTLPHYFIFIPYNDQRSQELFQFLQEKYTPLWQCDSSRFPAIFFKLKGD